MIRKTTSTIFLITLLTSVFAQSESVVDSNYVLEEDEYVLSFDSLTTKDKMHVSFVLGAGFGHSNTYGNYFNTYYKPMISYDVSSKFSINTGITYVNSSVDNIPMLSDRNYQLFSGNISQYYAFAGGEYKLTNRLIVGGSVFYDFTSYNAFDGTKLSSGSGLDNLGYSAYLQYKVAKGLTFEAEIRMNDRNPYNRYSSLLSNGFMGVETAPLRRTQSFFGR